jgi:UDP-N-acetylmuramoyl-tripeptide--D-alanyl-D-alanine ligase
MSTLAAAAESMHGELHGADHPFNGVSTDTRTLQRGELFVALQGPNFDGCDYVGQARDKGAAGAVVPRIVDVDIAQIAVQDSRRALGELGAAWRAQVSPIVVGVTGSNGKTTLKELTAACLATAAPTLATHGNLNNDIGMPLMLTRIEDRHRFAVLEMGANHAGEIAYLTALARPDVVVITNAGAAHLEGFGSLDGVARAKGEILCGETRPKVAILNADDRYFDYWTKLVEDTRLLRFGIDADADVYARNIVAQAGCSSFDLHLPGGEIGVTLPLSGLHNVRNACAAAAIAVAVGIDIADIKSALESVQPVEGRLRRLAGIHGATIYDDSYNANPLSVVAAAEFLASQPGDGVLVLGDMGELGEDAAELHAETGAQIRQAGISRLLATGDLCQNTVDSFGEGASWHADVDELTAGLKPELREGMNVLVKGSRFMRMERVVEALRDPRAVSKEA